MKLSEAIRLGAMMKPQAFGDYYDADGGSCAIGAAFDAIGSPIVGEDSLWPIFKSLDDVPCPICGPHPKHLITHLNDDHRWTRERIADFVATLEVDEKPIPFSSPSLEPSFNELMLEKQRRKRK